ncbi:hypothetical protein GCK32_022919 [Trichostrongylus colubriformis]|uniref:Uncharacterized protein n=1 Tax=Trichostrongylus colubriformis TaxID=6319 RepID=A0AAN8J2Q4_TRICO
MNLSEWSVSAYVETPLVNDSITPTLSTLTTTTTSPTSLASTLIASTSTLATQMLTAAMTTSTTLSSTTPDDDDIRVIMLNDTAPGVSIAKWVYLVVYKWFSDWCSVEEGGEGGVNGSKILLPCRSGSKRKTK